MCREIFKRMAERQVKGLMFHSDMADYYGFLNLKLFQDFHDKQYIEESQLLRKIKDYFINKNHQTLLLDAMDLPTPLTPSAWDDKTSADVDKETVQSLLKTSLETYYSWEHETCELYKDCANSLFDWGYYDDYCFVRCLIDDVEKELNRIKTLQIDLATVNYDITKMKGLQYKL